MNTLSGRTCVFAGGTGNLGRCAVLSLAEGGMNVALLTHNFAQAEKLMNAAKDLPGRILIINENENLNPYEVVQREFGSVDVIINAIGSLEKSIPLEEISEGYLDFKLQHQIKNVFQMVQRGIPYVKSSRAGRIILTATGGAVTGFDGENIVDSMTRGSTLALTKCLAELLVKDGVTVNCIARSGMEDDHEKERETDFEARSVLDRIPLGRLGRAAEYASLVAYLASEESGFMTGQILRLTGGLH